MAESDPSLYERVKRYYNEVRNPIMHGYEVDSHSYDGVVLCFDLISDIYAWTDSWFPADSIVPPFMSFNVRE